MAALTVGIPVFNAPDALAACLETVARHTPRGHPVLVLDDASDDPAIPGIMARHRHRPGWHFERARENRGFVASANRIMAAAAGDVVLLNSDTLVTRGWLEALIRCAASDSRIATVTPFSNNAEICSFPRFCAAHPVPADPDRVAAAIARAGAPVYPRIPTAVGFCMLLRRVVLDDIGYFDAESFGRGYGEENDYCMRAAAADYVHVLCDDAYVAHRGGASFAATGLAPGAETMARLVARHPGYEALIADFIARDPIAPRRQAILARMTPAERSLVEPAA